MQKVRRLYTIMIATSMLLTAGATNAFAEDVLMPTPTQTSTEERLYDIEIDYFNNAVRDVTIKLDGDRTVLTKEYYVDGLARMKVAAEKYATTPDSKRYANVWMKQFQDIITFMDLYTEFNTVDLSTDEGKSKGREIYHKMLDAAITTIGIDHIQSSQLGFNHLWKQLNECGIKLNESVLANVDKDLAYAMEFEENGMPKDFYKGILVDKPDHKDIEKFSEWLKLTGSSLQSGKSIEIGSFEHLKHNDCSWQRTAWKATNEDYKGLNLTSADFIKELSIIMDLNEKQQLYNEIEKKYGKADVSKKELDFETTKVFIKTLQEYPDLFASKRDWSFVNGDSAGDYVGLDFNFDLFYKNYDIYISKLQMLNELNKKRIDAGLSKFIENPESEIQGLISIKATVEDPTTHRDSITKGLVIDPRVDTTRITGEKTFE